MMPTRHTYRLFLLCWIFFILLSGCDDPTPQPPQGPPSGNNTGSQSSTLPDLHIVGADLQKEDLHEGIYTINLLVENRGVSTSNSFVTQCYWECAAPTGDYHLTWHNHEDGLVSKDTPTLASIRGFDIACEPLPSSLRFECRIDTGENVEESDEDNNTWSGTLNVPIIP